MIIGFLLVIFLVPIITKIIPPKDTSHFENRALKTPPVFSTSALLEGKYLPEWEEYFSDHIALRDEMIYAYTYLNANILKKTVVNNIVITKNALLPFNSLSDVNEKQIQDDAIRMAEKISKLNDFITSNGGVFCFIGIPEQSSMLRNEYPIFLENADKKLTVTENAFFSALSDKGIKHINMMDTFKNDDYFKYYSVTDHHYNIHGAFKTYERIIDELELDNALQKSDFNYYEYPNNFYGSRARIIYKAYNMPDKLGIYTPKKEIEFTRIDSGTQVNWLFYQPQNEKEDITYNVYMGWDSAETYVYTKRPELPRILIFGDSFTNPLETILYTASDTMLSVDLRHNKKSIYEYIEEFKPDIVLLVRDDTCYTSFDGNGSF